MHMYNEPECNSQPIDEVASAILQQQSSVWLKLIQSKLNDYLRQQPFYNSICEDEKHDSSVQSNSFKDSTSPCNSSVSIDSQIFDSSISSQNTSLKFEFKPFERPILKVPSPGEALKSLHEQRNNIPVQPTLPLTNPMIPNTVYTNFMQNYCNTNTHNLPNFTESYHDPILNEFYQGKENIGLDLSLQKKDVIKSPVRQKFACKICPKSYQQASALKMHIRTHTLPCRCQHCGKSFSRKWLLKGHERTHTGERPYQCTVCGRSFADRSNLRAHMQTHQNDKRYKCPTCPRSFSRMGLLNKHLSQTNCAQLMKS